jgi:DNA repair protein RadC
MERPKWHKSPKYQLGFDFGQRSLDASAVDDLRFTYAVKEAVQVRTPADAGHYLLTHVFTPFAAFDQEEVWVLLLNNKNVITHQSMIYRGTFNTVQMRVSEVFKPAVRFNAAGIVVSHSHPSGDPAPSPEDIAVTQVLYNAGKLLQVDVLDHIIVGRDCWRSLKHLGVGFEETP